jgi:predicted transglutaminase-like cysteine proteinase
MNPVWTSCCRLFGALAIAVAGSLAAPAGAIAAPSGLFETIEFNGVPLPPWRGFVAGQRDANAAFERCAAGGACPDQAIRGVLAELDSLAALPRRTQAESVHRLVNARPYRSDVEAYGRGDHWATPLEFLAKAGDCEDFAIFKYFLLRRLGFEPSALRIVLGRDSASGGSHAILVALIDGATLVLDNTRNSVVDAASIRFDPIYSFNETERIGHFAARAPNVAALAAPPQRPAAREISATAGFAAAR